MSIVGDFVKAASAAAMPAIGVETVAIDGGDSVNAVLNEINTIRDYDIGGHEPVRELRAVVKVVEFDLAYPSAANAYLGKSVAVRGITMVVAGINKGAEFVEIELADEEAAR
jgi:hypothetical protein